MLAALAAAVCDTVPRVAFSSLEAALVLAPFASTMRDTVERAALS